MTNKAIAGDRVRIYQDPYTKKDLEGEAVLLYYYTKDLLDGLEWWKVRFDNGDIVNRWVDPRKDRV